MHAPAAVCETNVFPGACCAVASVSSCNTLLLLLLRPGWTGWVPAHVAGHYNATGGGVAVGIGAGCMFPCTKNTHTVEHAGTPPRL